MAARCSGVPICGKNHLSATASPPSVGLVDFALPARAEQLSTTHDIPDGSQLYGLPRPRASDPFDTVPPYELY